jgi:hypothetical protein
MTTRRRPDSNQFNCYRLFLPRQPAISNAVVCSQFASSICRLSVAQDAVNEPRPPRDRQPGPWYDRGRMAQRFQFRLRTLMIAVTLISVVVGTIRISGPPWLDMPGGREPRPDWGLLSGWLIIIATEFYVVWIILRFTCRR